MNPKANLKLILTVSFFLPALSIVLAQQHSKSKAKYSVAAYVWPSCHDEKMSQDALWGEGIGEWEIIKKGTPRFEGHYQPRVPLWGYKMDDDPKAWEQKITAATTYGVNVFIFDWYWFNEKPFLEEALDSGFLKAKNNGDMKFYIMWANHDAVGSTWNPYRYKNDSILWPGEVDWKNFKIIVDRVINQYFKQPNYYIINNKPVFSIYNLTELVQGFKSMSETVKALDYFRNEVKKAGFAGLHLQTIGRGPFNPFLIQGKFGEGLGVNDIVEKFNINSVTMYNWTNHIGLEDYISYGERALALRHKWDSIMTIPFFPVVSVGWDDTPRFLKYGKDQVIHFNNTPASFGAYLQKTKEYVDQRPEQEKLIIINAWNEWVEGSYLEPDMKNGYGYLEEVRKVLNGDYDLKSVK